MYRAKLAILASTALCMGMGLSQAADMPAKALVAKAPIADPDPWVGLYVGGNLGYSWGRSDTTTSVAPFVQNALFAFAFPGGNSAPSLSPNGVVGGAQIGNIWRVTQHWLAGLEADFQWSGQKNSKRDGLSGATTDCTSGDCSYANIADITAKLSWFGTLRGLVGVEWNGLWLYGTSGLAFGGVSISGTNTVSLFDNVGQAIVGLYSTPFSYSTTRVGFTVGLGIQGLIRGTAWRWKAEFIHIDLGSIGGGSFGTVPLVTLNTTSFTDDIVRFGFNYRFTAGP